MEVMARITSISGEAVVIGCLPKRAPRFWERRQKKPVALLTIVTGTIFAQAPPPRPEFVAFEEMVIKPTHPNYQISEGRLMAMQSAHRFVAQHYTLKALTAAAFNLNPDAVIGGPEWIDSDRYDILALTPNSVRPNLDEQMTMLRNSLVDRFSLKFRRQPKTLPIYE